MKIRNVLLLCIYSITIFSMYYTINACDCLVPILKETGSRSVIKIRAADFNYNPTVGNAAYVISQPGIYYLEDYVSVTPGIDNLSLIYINSSNVKLNFNSFVINQSNGSFTKNINIVEVAPNLTNIAIINGVFQDINGIGIKVNLNVSNLYITNMVIDKLTNLGIYLNNARNVVLSQTSITNCDGSSSNSVDGALSVKLQNSSDLLISNCYFNSNVAKNSNADGTGLIADNCVNLKIENCSSSGNSGQNAYGFVFRNGSSSCTLQNCSSVTCQSNNGRTVGFLFNNSSSSSLSECNSELHKSVGGDCAGYMFEGQSGYYFSANLKNYNVTKCEAKNNKALSASYNTFGFNGNLLNFAIFNSCSAVSNSSANGNVYGFYISNSKYNSFYKCMGFNQDASSSENNAYGFCSSGGLNNNFESCAANDNISGSLNSSVVAGFAFLNGETNSSIKKSTAMNNYSLAGQSYGISLGFDTDSNTHINNIINENYIANNKGGSKQYGYRDFASVTTTNLIANTSFGQGRINPSPISQLVLENNMNYMFTLPVNKAPAYVVVESSIGEVAEIKVKPFGNLSIY